MGIAIAFFCLINVGFSQGESERPAFITVTKMHWNMDQEDFDMDEWQDVEKQYLDKVTKKNDYIMGASFHMHMYTPDNTELLYVQLFKSWEDISKAQDRNDELAKEAWPDEDEREAYFKKQQGYYSLEHSDEIYVPIGQPKFEPDSDKDYIAYLRISKLAFPEDGTMKEFNELNNEFFQNVIMKTDKIKGYYPMAHAWGNDRRDYVEAFVVESLGDLENLRQETWEKAKEHWPDEAKRTEFFDKFDRYFLPTHEDYIYRSINGLSK